MQQRIGLRGSDAFEFPDLGPFAPGHNKGVQQLNEKPPTRKLPKLVFSDNGDIPSFRRKHKLTQSDFWQQIGVSQSSGSRYEHGREIPLQIRMLLQIVYGTPKQASSMFDWLRDAAR
ncbi:hypothetical protein C667_15239 [Thauera phenylacetica B4P]|uniref:RsaL-like HTH domain-containing protein n=1 Tax=Thauera phenylacetica B4P TaxID=1234382 RepID=N6ZVN5_9RHOO|nr:hypothetical protein C667_15239 [Thauera phenylacetica B4P]